MSRSNVLNLQQSSRPAGATACTVAGSWKLPAGRAITLNPRENGTLRVTHGGIWLTGGPLTGDQFIQPGQLVHLRTGQPVVIEPWNPGTRQASSYFSWEPHALAAASASHRSRAGTQRLAQDLDDLRAALGGLRAPLGLAFAAAARLAGGLASAGAGFAAALVRGRTVTNWG